MGFNIGRSLVGSVAGNLIAPGVGGIVGGALGGFGLGGKKQQGFNGGPAIPDFQMRKTSEFMPNTESVKIGGPNARQDISKGYAGLKEQSANKINAGLQGQSNALQRRFSALGAGGSGAQIKALQQAQETATQQQSDANSNIGFAETQALENRDLAQADMDFKQRLSNFEQGSKLHELDLAERQQKIDAATGEYNKRLSEFQAQPPKQGIISNLLGGIL